MNIKQYYQNILIELGLIINKQYSFNIKENLLSSIMSIYVHRRDKFLSTKHKNILLYGFYIDMLLDLRNNSIENVK